jgi:hypothetical protein
MREILITDAILFLIPNSDFRIVEDDLSTLEFFNPVGQKHPTQAEVDAAIKQIQANKKAEADKAEADKAAAQAKLAALGLTADDLKALGL